MRIVWADLALRIDATQLQFHHDVIRCEWTKPHPRLHLERRADV